MQEETLDDMELETSNEPETMDEEPSYEPQEGSQEEPTRLYAGKYKTVEEMEEAYRNANSENTKMAQKLKEVEKPKLPAEQQDILDELKSLGVVTKEDLSQKEYVDNLKAIDNAQIQSLKITDQQEKTLRNFAAHPDNFEKTMIECWQELSDSIGGGNVISRKTTIRPKAGSKGSDFKALTQDEVARLPDDQYAKYWEDYAANKAKS